MRNRKNWVLTIIVDEPYVDFLLVRRGEGDVPGVPLRFPNLFDAPGLEHASAPHEFGTQVVLTMSVYHVFPFFGSL